MHDMIHYLMANTVIHIMHASHCFLNFHTFPPPNHKCQWSTYSPNLYFKFMSQLTTPHFISIHLNQSLCQEKGQKKTMAIPRVEEENLVFDIKISSVVPGKITGENKTHELKGIDLAMKLHYLKGLYFFTNNGLSSTISVLSIHEAKKSMFDCLIPYFMACGRIRMSETSDRPTIKLNDAGVRVVEAKSSKTVDEWLAMEDFLSLQDHLVYNHVLGPDLPFSPLVCLQVIL